MLFGFFTTLPGIFRALQCLRRLYESGDVFPHLANAGKYTCTVLSYMSLSLMRIHKTFDTLAFLIAASTINSFYCIVWDIIMDFSLGNPSAKYPFLRDDLQFDHIWWYYAVMVIDPILRFNWLPYAIFAREAKHATIVSFLVATSEVIRRGIWVVFRMENEQCANNKRYKAIRLPPVPYGLSEPDTPVPASQSIPNGEIPGAGTHPSPLELTLKRIGSTMVTAHERDYRRKKPEIAEPADNFGGNMAGSDDDDDDDDDEE